VHSRRVMAARARPAGLLVAGEAFDVSAASPVLAETPEARPAKPPSDDESPTVDSPR